VAGESNSVPILLYHSLLAVPTPRYRPFAVGPDVFAEQIARIAQLGRPVLSVGEYAAYLSTPPLAGAPRPIVLTFDDGFVDTLEIGSRVLADHRFRATCYVVTGGMGGRSAWLDRDGEGAQRIMTPAQVRELEAAGFEIGSHSHRHVALDTLPFVEAVRQIDASRAALEDLLGHPVTTFAYPYGYHTGKIRAYLREAGYTSACGVKQALSHPGDDPYSLGRIIVGSNVPRDTFDGWLEGVGLPLSWRRERLSTLAWRNVRRVRSAFAGQGRRGPLDG
jgi:peptidoglycan/xylan/chitin deacetylase (PgdA/CDA1 family)